LNADALPFFKKQKGAIVIEPSPQNNEPEPKGEIEIRIAGQPVRARRGETIVHVLWAAGLAEKVSTGCLGGVCGACTVTLRFQDGRRGGTDLACMRPVEDGMEVFPFPVDPEPSVKPVPNPDADKLRAVFPTLDRCTKCGSCTTACPMSIPVMESVLRMQKGQLEDAAEDFTTCIHCGLCRVVCEDRVKPHNMGMWVRRSLGITRKHPGLDQVIENLGSAHAAEEWDFLLGDEDPEERLQRARQYRQKGRIPG
jgi:Fe-S oxidoreductase